MSDKSFGDHMNRGIVKNPLLSTAVTGMSIEDLTQNAVLLPVSLTQEHFGRPEPTQSTPTPSGDTFTPIHPPTEQNAKNPQKDDFDVNEYFARLQGTRYVSAPINILNDANANLEAKEENLEEINLNEPVVTEVEHSLTADIAQNFSQLPTVLPQMASAVFSSFSNMLSMKRESEERTQWGQTQMGAREGPIQMGQGVVPLGREAAQEVPLMGVTEREVAPPPKEPPTGPGNFRLTTKKKYAHIPGLSSGEPAQMPMYNPPAFNQPIFTPSQQEMNANFTNPESNIAKVDVGQSNPIIYNNNTPIIPVETSNNKSNVFESPKEVSNFVTPAQFTQDYNQQAIIAPPPMFSNLTKKDSAPNVGKTILPPSVARRIGSNKPTISNQAPVFATFDNIFVPAPVPTDAETTHPLDTSQTASFHADPSQVPPQLGLPPITPAPPTNLTSSTSNVFIPSQPTVKLAPKTSQLSSSTTIPTNITSEICIPENLPPSPRNVVPPPAMTSQPAAPLTSYADSAFILSPPQMYKSGTQSQILSPPTAFVSGNQSQATHCTLPGIPISSSGVPGDMASKLATTAPAQMFNPYMQGPPTISQPPVASEIEPPNLHVSILQSGNIESVLGPIKEPPKIPEPPKATGSTSFRMTKKRPQYYSGPIDGVGAISNNVKPTLPPVAVPAFQGAVFTPEDNTGHQSAVFTPENVTDNASTSQGAIFNPVAENQNQSSMFTALNVNVDTYNKQHAFDINYPAQTVGAPPVDINKVSEPSYGTSFDMSRQTTDTYEPPKQESAFGIIGSLKSKLSSIDINKLQNSVTTFFDPGYNVVETEVPKEHQHSYGPNQGIEICVANPEMYPQPYQYDAHQASFTYGQGSIPNASNYYNQQPHNVYSTNSYYSQPSYGTLRYSQTKLQGQQTNITSSMSIVDTEAAQCASVPIYQPTTSTTGYIQENTVEHKDGINLDGPVYSNEDNTTGFPGQFVKVPETVSPQSGANIDETCKNLQITEGNNCVVEQEIAEPVGVPLHSSKGTILLHSQVETNAPETTLEHKQSIEQAFKTLQITDGIDCIVNQQLTTSFGVSSINSGGDNITNEFQSHSESDLTGKPHHEECIKQEVENLQGNDEVKENISQINVEGDAVNKNMLHTASLLNPKVDTVSSYFDNENTLTAENAFLDVVNKKSSSNYFDMSENSENKIEALMNTEKSNFDNIFSAPLHDLSSMIADKSKEISYNASELKVDDEASDEQLDLQLNNDRLMALADPDMETLDQSEIDQKVDICQTCREVTNPDQKSADFTSQLIENITAPIQLLNPVEVPLTETDSSVLDNFDTINQGAEISLIAVETRETLQIQSATELLDGDDNTNIETNYGWRTEAPLPLGQDLLDHDYTFKADPNAIGFFVNNKLFFDDIPNNASDEIKAEYKVSHDEPPIVLQRQMSIPTAPPAEDSDDANSDETGMLDVQSIEQDASKDFPVFEEFVIEPSETDDDKLEIKDKNDEIKESFTTRVDRFKQQENNEDGSEQHKANPSAMMPSYFDTGNYAVETHFRNSLSSPTISNIPPGFEDYELTSKDMNKHEPIKVPDTNTQTSLTTTVSNVLTKTENLTSTVFSKMPLVQESQPETKLPDFASVFGAKIEFKETSISGIGNIEMPTKDTPVNPQVDIEDKVQDSKSVALPDPLNFFASTTQGPAPTEGVNRLASYFASPAKTDNTKSFFELSQGQNHYRQKIDEKVNEHKPFFELSQSQDHYKENINIPDIANLNLMNDLTSCQNMEPAKEQIIRTVNYFTVDYDNPDVLNLNKGEPEINKKIHTIHKENEYEIEETVLNHDETLMEIVNKCKYCLADPVLTVRETDFDSIGKVQFRQAMDSGASVPKEGVTMRTGKEGERSVSVRVDDASPDGDNSEGVAMMTENRSSNDYEPVKHHWFYRVDCEDKSIWRGFSTTDSKAIENAFQSPDLNENTLVPTDGGRYDVNIVGRLRIAVYWSDTPTNVRRCSWFYKGTTDARYVPYTESVAEKLEEEYRHGVTTGEWHRRLVLPNSELVVMHGPAVMVHFLQSGSTDPFGAPNLCPFGKRVYRNPPKFKVSAEPPRRVDHLLLLVHGAGESRCQKDKIQTTMRPRVVRRGIDESEIEDPEPSSIDHLLLLCHGVGSACDMRFRPVEEVVDDFRSTSLQLLQSHYRNSYDSGTVGRVEVLPISWHTSLHSGPKGVDRRLARVTLSSIPRLRNFTNDTVLDVLFYTSPHYCQMILDTVCSELNRIYTLFIKRNPGFKGQVSLGGHSLGSVILYDLLCNQPFPSTLSPKPTKTYLTDTLAVTPTVSRYPELCFQPFALFGLGSPIAIFECIRGVEMLGADFCLPTCRHFFNIFHPYDPIAYRIEPLVNPHLQNVKPSLIPHHKGRKRMHLELKDTMARVGADLKQKLVESIKSTWSSMWSSAAPPDHHLEKVVEEEIEKEQLEEERSKEEPVLTDLAPGEMLGRLNSGRRIDYVLQEAPFEIFNEYLFAMTSHVCYWESEDVMLLILREIYDSMGVQPDVTVPQQSMSVQRPVGQQLTTNATDASTSRI